MAEPRAAKFSGPLPAPIVVRVDPKHVAAARAASADYASDHERMRDIAAQMAEVADEERAALFRRFAYYALRASRAEVA